MKRKDAKEISVLISAFMQKHKFTLSDLNRGMVILTNIEHDYVWKNGFTVKPEKVEITDGQSCPIDLPKKKKRKESTLDVLAECSS